MTDKTKEALKLALEAITTYLSESLDPSEEAVEGLCDARALIAKALAEQPAQQCWKCGDMDVAFQMKCTVPACGMKEQPAQPQQEPVAWALSHSRGLEFSSKYPMQKSMEAAEQMARQHMGAVTVTPLYTSPPAQRTWAGLTDEEVKHEWVVWRASIPRYMGFAKGIEAKLRKKNT